MTGGDRLKELRTRMGLSPIQLAARAGVPAPTIFMWEKDRLVPTPQQIDAIARALGVHASVIAGEEYARAAAMRQSARETAYDPKAFEQALSAMLRGLPSAAPDLLEQLRVGLQDALRAVKAELRGRD